MGAKICGCTGNGINIAGNELSTRLHFGRDENLPFGHTGKTIRNCLSGPLPNSLVGIIWEYTRELEVCFPPRHRPIVVRFIGRRAGSTYSDSENLWCIPEITCSLSSIGGGLYFKFTARNPGVTGHKNNVIWNGMLLYYGEVNDKKYFDTNPALMALAANSTIFSKSYRKYLECVILPHPAMVGIEYMISDVFDGMHNAWMLDMTRQW